MGRFDEFVTVNCAGWVERANLLDLQGKTYGTEAGDAGTWDVQPNIGALR
jgi:hypothetical protein